MRICILICLLFLIGSLAAQEVDSIRSSAVLINYSALHSNAPHYGPDTIQVNYNKRGNEVSKVLISDLGESHLGTPLIYRNKYDSLDRIIKMEAYAFSLDNSESSLTLQDTSTALMDTILVYYQYQGDTSMIERYEYRHYPFGILEVEKTVTYTLYDSLGRETYLYALNPEKIKTREHTMEYSEGISVTSKTLRHDGGDVYSELQDTVFNDTLGRAFMKRLYGSKNSKYYPFSSCGDCEHLYFRNDSSQVVRELWQDFKGFKRKETFYEYDGDKIVLKTSQIFQDIKRGDSVRVEKYSYDGFGNVVYYELNKRNRASLWQKILIQYTPRIKPTRE